MDSIPANRLGERLRQARTDRQLSTREVADRLAASSSGRTAVSHATVANYERGKTVPPAEVLAALAEVYRKPLAWFLDAPPTLSGIRYRETKSRVRAAERQSYETTAARWVEAYVRVEELLDAPLVQRF